MSERIEYQGVPLPSGLPGYGGGSVSVLTLPGFSTVVSPKRFGPFSDLPPGTTDPGGGSPPVPNPTPPAGNTPSNPTDDVVDPPTPPVSQPGGQDERMTSLCNNKVCSVTQLGFRPLAFGDLLPDPICTACNKAGNYPVVGGFTQYSDEYGVFWEGGSKLKGLEGENNKWQLEPTKLILTYQNSFKEFEPKELKVCTNGDMKTWKVLAYQED